MPQELQEYIQSLPPSTINNARSIERENIRRILNKNQHQSAKILNARYGTDYDYKGNCAHDWGNEPANYNHE
jgi:hypothetical protein